MERLLTVGTTRRRVEEEERVKLPPTCNELDKAMEEETNTSPRIITGVEIFTSIQIAKQVMRNSDERTRTEGERREHR